jgi:hypothetical protein
MLPAHQKNERVECWLLGRVAHATFRLAGQVATSAGKIRRQEQILALAVAPLHLVKIYLETFTSTYTMYLILPISPLKVLFSYSPP